MATVSVRLSDELFTRLKTLLAERNMNLSDFFRDILERELDNVQTAAPLVQGEVLLSLSVSPGGTSSATLEGDPEVSVKAKAGDRGFVITVTKS